MTKQIILDLCGGTGSWSLPYKEAGFDVLNITLPDYDVREFVATDKSISFDDGENWTDFKDIYGIFAAPPCTMFSDARTKAKEPRNLRDGFEVVQACLGIIYECQYRTKSDQQKCPPLKFWALENPWYGRLKWFLGHPKFTFSPWEFGDAYKKKTAVWGYFNEPIKTVTDIKTVLSPEQIEKHKTNSQVLPKFDYMKSGDIAPEWFGKLDRQARRAITPKGFAQAFFKANSSRYN